MQSIMQLLNQLLQPNPTKIRQLMLKQQVPKLQVISNNQMLLLILTQMQMQTPTQLLMQMQMPMVMQMLEQIRINSNN